MSLDAIGIVCSDLEKTKNFYGILGLEFVDSGSGEHWEAKTPSGLRIMLDSVHLMKKINPQWERALGNTLTLAFVQKTPGDVDKVAEALLAQGGTSVKSPWDAFWGQRYATVKDPDGHPVDLFADLPKSMTSS